VNVTTTSDDIVLRTKPLGFPWETDDPFLFCVHHDDAYPAGNERLGPAASLAGRNLGQDFEGHPPGAQGGWRMYHGHEVPGFPQHPHRGFETVTIVRRGLIDHSDSLGAAARFGGGDVQWVTAGKGIVHSEMFPLLDRKQGNPLELFQIWLNLPHEDKMVEPHFTMLWREAIPTVVTRDAAGKATTITIAAGHFGDAKAPPPPPKSWASRPDTDLAIWTIKLEPGATWTLPRAARTTNRRLYFFRGKSLRVGGKDIPAYHGAELRPDVEAPIVNGPEESELLLLQGRPIAQPVVQYGPFVMGSRAEIQQAFVDYQRTHFGGWPWPVDDPVHAREDGRFARHADGRVERVG
jgi:redox-sensitive bicupin YhaK (pirin superfamily)